MCYMAQEVVAEKKSAGGGAFYIKYRPGNCIDCEKTFYWRSVNGRCWECELENARNIAVRNQNFLKGIFQELNPWDVSVASREI